MIPWKPDAPYLNSVPFLSHQLFYIVWLEIECQDLLSSLSCPLLKLHVLESHHLEVPHVDQEFMTNLLLYRCCSSIPLWWMETDGLEERSLIPQCRWSCTWEKEWRVSHLDHTPAQAIISAVLCIQSYIWYSFVQRLHRTAMIDIRTTTYSITETPFK